MQSLYPVIKDTSIAWIKDKMTIAEEIYKFIGSKGIVVTSELVEFSRDKLGKDYKYLYKQYLFPFLKKGRIKRVRRGMYAAVNIFQDNDQLADRYIIASKIRPRYYLGFHTALELHGCAYSAFRKLQIAIHRSDYFRPFEFEECRYQPVTQSNIDLEVTTIKYNRQNIKISSASRTFVDCINRRYLVGGLEECLKSLDAVGGVKVQAIDKILELYGNNLLLRSVGYFLEKMKVHSPYYGHITESDIRTLEKKVGKPTMYMEPGIPSEYNKKWNLYIPKNIDGLMRGI